MFSLSPEKLERRREWLARADRYLLDAIGRDGTPEWAASKRLAIACGALGGALLLWIVAGYPPIPY